MPGLSAYKYLDSEREIDAGEDPTQRVSEYLVYTTLITLVNRWYAIPSFWCHPDASEPLCGETLAPLEKSLAYGSTAFMGARRG